MVIMWQIQIKCVFIFHVLYLCSTATTVPTFNVVATGDNQIEIYFDGIKQTLVHGSNWKTPDTLVIPIGTEILGIYCEDKGSFPGILASLNDGRVTDTDSWKCSNKHEEHWNIALFDDSQWQKPVSMGQHGVTPWNNIAGISSNAHWIWTSGGSREKPTDEKVYCRTRLKTIEVFATCVDNMNLYADGFEMGSHNNKASSKFYNIPARTKVVGIKCTSNSVTSNMGGILATFKREFKGDYITDATWRCYNQFKSGWPNADFDDSTWMYAEVLSNNTAVNSVRPADFAHINDISTYANWIWTKKAETKSGDLTVYCRGHIAIEQTADNYGRVFVAAYIQNLILQQEKDIKLLISTLKPTRVTVLIKTPLIPLGSPGYVDKLLTVKAGEVVNYILPRVLRHEDNHNIQNKGVLILATDSVRVVGENQEKYSTDLFLLVPPTSFGIENTTNEFYAVCWDINKDCRVLFAAAYDNTLIKVTATDSITYGGKTYAIGETFEVLLTKKYQTLQLGSSTTNGLTGTHILSYKPVLVYSGNRKTRVAPDNKGSLDHIVEQLNPTYSWGKFHILTPLPYGPDNNGKTRAAKQLTYYKILAAESDTEITIKSYYETDQSLAFNDVAKIQAGGVHSYTHIRGTVAVVNANKGIYINQFATTKTTVDKCLGDPWMQFMPSVYQYKRDYSLLTPALEFSAGCDARHYFTVIIKDKYKADLLINNKRINVSQYHLVPTTEYVYQTVELVYGVHRVQHVKTFVSYGLYFFGYGNYDSYGTAGGTVTAPINRPCVVKPSVPGDSLDNDCNGEIDEDECVVSDPIKDCALPAPINGGWSAWKTSGPCVCPSGTTNGKQPYERSCSNPVPRYDGWPCDTSVEGDKKEVDCICQPVNGGWSQWSLYSDCSLTCDPGTKSRSRSCSNPYPANGGSDCQGSRFETVSCTLLYCPIDGGWTNWTMSGSCICPLGETDGVKWYNRSCSNPVPQYGGKACNTSKHGITKTESCNCPEVVCDRLPNIQNGNFDHPNCTTIGRVYRDVCKGQCNTGYYNTADEVFTCTKYGTWSSNNYTQCQIHHCPAIPSVTSNTKCPTCNVLPTVLNPNYDSSLCRTTGLDYNHKCIGSCDVGYNLVGHSHFWCNSNGHWNSTSFPHCQIVHCNAIPVPGNGSYTPLSCQTQGRDYPQNCKLGCNIGYRVEGNANQKCRTDELWTDQVQGSSMPYCKTSICSYPSEGVNSTISLPPPPLMFGFYATYKCEHGFEIQSGDTVRYCLITEQWSGVPLKCKSIKCQGQITPLHTTAINATGQSEYEYKDTIKYECDIGYELLSGDLERTCQIDKTFSGSPPVCRKQLCYILPTVPNAKMVVGSGEYLDAVTYECLPGYKKTSGQLKRHCLLTKVWNGTSPTCTEIKCDQPPSIPNAYLHVDAMNYTAKTHYGCIKGYTKTGGDEYLVCNVTGQWTGTKIQCEEITCGPVSSDPQKVTTVFGTIVYNKTLRECTSGYDHDSGISTAMCQENKQWEVINPVCKEINCGLPYEFHNVEIAHGPTIYNSMTAYTCKQGMVASSPVQSQCKEDGWSVQEVNCNSMQCNDIAVPGTELDFSTGKEHLDLMTWNCAPYYTLVDGDTGRTCQSGSWTGPNLQCQETTCQNLTKYEDISISINSSSVDSKAVYQCEPLHAYQSGDLIRTCTSSGVWTGRAPACSDILCPQIRYDWPLLFILEGYSPGSYAYQSCAKGYKIHNSNQQHLQCSTNGSWVGEISVCSVVTCDVLPIVINGTITAKNNTYKSEAKVVCDEGFELHDGTDVLICNENGDWIGDMGSCKVKECPIPYLPVYGRLNLTSLTVGSMVTFDCEHMYEIKGSPNRTCLSTGIWSGVMPVCERVKCGKPPEITNAHWNWDKEHYPMTEKAIYACNPSFSAENNETLEIYCLATGEWTQNFTFICIKNSEYMNVITSNGYLFKEYKIMDSAFIVFKDVDYYLSHIYVGSAWILIFVIQTILLMVIDISNIRRDWKLLHGNVKSFVKNR